MDKHHIKRTEKEITDKTAIDQLLMNGKYAVLALCRNNEPYIVTLSCGYQKSKNTLYFHCANTGLKLDFIHDNPFVCGTIIEDKGYKDGACDHAYKSVIFRGKIEMIKEIQDKCDALRVMIEHLERDPKSVSERIFSGKMNRINTQTTLLKLKIESITGKHGQG